MRNKMFTFTRIALKFMRCKVSIPQRNSLIDVTNKLPFRTYLSSVFTILICSLSSVAVPSDLLRLDAIAQTWLLAVN